MKPNNVIYRKCTKDSFYKDWVEFLTPYHKLTTREREVFARIIQQYFYLKQRIPDPEVLKEVLWSSNSQKDIRTSLHMTPEHFCIMKARLRKAGVLIDDDINKKYLPHKTDSSRFMLQIVYDWSTPKMTIDDASE